MSICLIDLLLLLVCCSCCHSFNILIFLNLCRCRESNPNLPQVESNHIRMPPLSHQTSSTMFICRKCTNRTSLQCPKHHVQTITLHSRFAVYDGYDPSTLPWQGRMISHFTNRPFCGANGTRTRTTHRDRVVLLPFNHGSILSRRWESNPLTDGSRPPVLKTLVTSRFAVLTGLEPATIPQTTGYPTIGRQNLFV